MEQIRVDYCETSLPGARYITYGVAGRPARGVTVRPHRVRGFIYCAAWKAGIGGGHRRLSSQFRYNGFSLFHRFRYRRAFLRIVPYGFPVIGTGA